MNYPNNSYAIRNKFLANSLGFITGQRYHISKDVNDRDVTVYVFERTEKLMEALTELNQLKKKHTN